MEIGDTLIHELGHYFGMSEDEIMEIEERYWRGEQARKRFGQHFLEPAWVAKLVDAVAPSPASRSSRSVRAAAPSPWPLVERSGRVLAVEVDRDLAAALRARNAAA